ncbi:hypothetical protein A2U01_0071482, partial [Trifolium medium]|nr:hypothetical protein [Trifolium medium]
MRERAIAVPIDRPWLHLWPSILFILAGTAVVQGGEGFRKGA